MSEHILPSKMYYAIWIALMVLTVVTPACAFIDLGPFNTVVALADCVPARLCSWSCSLCT